MVCIACTAAVAVATHHRPTFMLWASSHTGKYSVPVLWDLEKSTIVSNESAEIIRMFNDAFNEFATNAELDLYPEALRPAIDAVNEWIYPV